MIPHTITFAQGDATWHAYRERSLTDLFFFADVVLGYGQAVPMTPKAHLLMTAFASRATGVPILDDAWCRLVLVPRGVGKSTLLTQARPLQLALKYPDCALLIANEKMDGATKFLAEIKNQCATNAFLRALFPELIWENPEKDAPKWSESEATLKRTHSRKEPTFQAIGVGGALTGMHPDHAFVDDMLSDEAAENARIGSFAIIEKINRWVSQLRPIVNSAEPWHGMTFIGTPWWEGDSYQHVEKAFGYGEAKQTKTLKTSVGGSTIAVECYRLGDLAVFRRPILENGTSWFPERWPDEKLAKMRVDDALLFNANMMLNPTAPELVEFKPDWKRYVEWSGDKAVSYRGQDFAEKSCAIADLDVVMSVDPAFTEGGTSDSRQAIMVSGGTPEGLRILLKAQATKQSLDGFLRDIVEFVRTYKPRKLLLEKAGQQITFINDVKARLASAGLYVSVELVTPGGKNKDKRIATLGAFFERGVILAHRDAHDFWREYDGFPRSKYKDLLDALAYQPPFWNIKGSDGGQPAISASAQVRVQKEIEDYRRRRGLPSVPAGRDALRYREDGSARW